MLLDMPALEADVQRAAREARRRADLRPQTDSDLGSRGAGADRPRRRSSSERARSDFGGSEREIELEPEPAGDDDDDQVLGDD